MEYPKKRCETCSEWFTPTRKSQVRCSKACRLKAQYENRRKLLEAALKAYKESQATP